MNISYPKNYIVWDVETTGVDPIESFIIEISAIKVENFNVVETFDKLLNYDIEIPTGATDIHGITREEIEKKGESPSLVIEEFLDFITQDGITPTVTHNGTLFDLKFLDATIQDLAIDWKGLEHMALMSLDTAAIYKAKYVLSKKRFYWENNWEFQKRIINIRSAYSSFNLEHCCEKLGIEVPDQEHRALSDVLITNELYKHLIKEL